MKRTFAFITAAALCGVFAVSVGALAAKPEDPGSGGGGNAGGQGGGKPTTDVYAEMVIVDRDVNGVPIMTDGLGPKDKVGLVPWPIMLDPKDGCPLWNDDTGPVLGEGFLSAVDFPSVYSALEIEAYRIPFVDYEIEYPECTTEADVGRLSVVRAPDDVLDRALLEMVNTLAQANDPGETITLDAAGRLVVNYFDVDDVLVSKTIDAPAENVAAFQRILEQAQLYHALANGGEAIALPGLTDPDDARGLLDRTAAMLGAGADKFGHVGLDDVIYVTQILTIAGDMNDDAKVLFGEPWTDELGGEYFDFSAFEYDRSMTYAGEVCYLKVTSVVGNIVTGEIVNEPIMGLIFDKDFFGTNAYAYAKAVDDARAVIFWTHEHPVPAELIDLCDPQTGDAVAVRADMTPSKLYQQ